MTSQFKRTKVYRNNSKINLFSEHYLKEQPLTIHYRQNRMGYHQNSLCVEFHLITMVDK